MKNKAMYLRGMHCGLKSNGSRCQLQPATSPPAQLRRYGKGHTRLLEARGPTDADAPVGWSSFCRLHSHACYHASCCAGEAAPKCAAQSASRRSVMGDGNCGRCPRRCAVPMYRAKARTCCCSQSGMWRTSSAASTSDRLSTAGRAAPRPGQGPGICAHCSGVSGHRATRAG